ncbi:MAG: NifU family protein, partial [Actinomycetota bacterium]|nr:NifU family protein [Actinomycetota bacterium]
MEDADVRQEVEALDEALAAVEELPDGEARRAGLAAVEALVRVYGEGLRRIVDGLSGAAEIAEELAADEVVGHLLLLHGLHPATLEERVAQALEEVRPYMGSHGGGVELVDVAGGVARVRLQGTCSGCAASTMTMKLAIEEAVLRAAPEVHAVEAVEEGAPAPAGLKLPMFDGKLSVVSSPGQWTSVGILPPPASAGQPLRRDVGGRSLLFVALDGELYAYVDRCPGCLSEMKRPAVLDDTLVCGGCGRRFDVRRAGQA